MENGEANNLKNGTRPEHRVDIQTPHVKAEDKSRKSAAWGAQRVLHRMLPKKGPREICVSFVGDGRIRQLNKSYLGRDRVTDVLSFPLGSRVDGFWHLGDVVICLPQARRQAKKRSHGLAREIAILAVHGSLHLLGYNHDTPKDPMSKIESEIMKDFKIR